jgi:peptide/nickel transport system ATP-binding protein
MQIIFQDPFSSLDPRKTLSWSHRRADARFTGCSVKETSAIQKRTLELMETVGLAQRLDELLPARARRRPPPAHRHRPRARPSTRS